MGKIIIYAVAVYVLFRAGRYLLSLGMRKDKSSEQKEKYFNETEIRDAEFTDVDEKEDDE